MAGWPITLMLQEFAAGDKTALHRLTPHVYSELRKPAGRHLKNERSGHTRQPTALVHEAYVRLIGNDQPDYRSRAHFPQRRCALDAAGSYRSCTYPQRGKSAWPKVSLYRTGARV